GDVITVMPGVYYERINFYGLAITVQGSNPADMNTVYATIIDAYGGGTAVTFDSGEGKESILDGVSLKNGGNGIYCYYSAPIIRNCSISGNSAKGIYGNNSTCDILNCRIAENSGATGIYDCDGDIIEPLAKPQEMESWQ
ncbi:MAG: hypothetical protein JEZ07_16525, partial [Phycisphaerae bacterium]|nr:hypothetical protein [Phycisphaerae bacterium]